MKENLEWNDSTARESITTIIEVNGIQKFALIYDPHHFSIDFVREFRDKVRWIFNCGPYDEKVKREFNVDEDPYGFLREKYK